MGWLVFKIQLMNNILLVLGGRVAFHVKKGWHMWIETSGHDLVSGRKLGNKVYIKLYAGRIQNVTQ